MKVWRPQLYRKVGESLGVDPGILDRATAIGERITAIHPEIHPIFTLNHLANVAGVDYRRLRAFVSREEEDPYRIFRINKRPLESQHRRFRVICVPDPELMAVQRWISGRILAFARPHTASVAYAKGSDIRYAASLHCECRWLIKLDIQNFFESISEIDIFNVFRSLNFEPLVSFEMARLCSRLGRETAARTRNRWVAHTHDRFSEFPVYRHERIGHLPQGAPTSPMLANLAVRELDQNIASLAAEHGLTYTRYADDICLSTKEKAFRRSAVSRIVGGTFKVMARHGFSPNVSKTHVVAPGARKIVLGLLVDGPSPKLPKEFRKNLRRHIYYLTRPEIGPAAHALSRGFAAIAGLRNHVQGLIRFASHIEPQFADRCDSEFRNIQWPI